MTYTPPDLPRHLVIVYEDAAGARTERTISVRGYRPLRGDIMVEASCSLRRANRSFRASRIRSARDAITGAPVDLSALRPPPGPTTPTAARHRESSVPPALAVAVRLALRSPLGRRFVARIGDHLVEDLARRAARAIIAETPRALAWARGQGARMAARGKALAGRLRHRPAPDPEPSPEPPDNRRPRRWPFRPR